MSLPTKTRQTQNLSRIAIMGTTTTTRMYIVEDDLEAQEKEVKGIMESVELFMSWRTSRSRTHTR